YNTNKADVLISMWSRLQAALHRPGIDLTKIPLTMDAWLVAPSLRHRLHALGFTKIIMAGKSHYPFPIDGKKQEASPGKQALVRHDPTWGIDVPSCRVHAQSPTFGALLLVFFQKSTTRRYDLMHFSQASMRRADIWHSWTQQHWMECFWKILKSIFRIRARQCPGHGLYTAVRIKVLAYGLAIRLHAR